MIKIVTLILVFCSTFLFAELKFEKVFSINNNKDVNIINKIYFHGDSVLVFNHQYKNTDSTKHDSYISFSSNSGIDWMNLNSNFPDKLPRTYDLFSEELFSFVLHDVADTSINYVDINGFTYKSLKYPFRIGFPEIEIIPRDTNFIGVHYNFYSNQPLYYRDRYLYSLNNGITWDSISPEIQYKDFDDRKLEEKRLIENVFNYQDPSIALFRFKYMYMNKYPYSVTGKYDIYTKKFKFYTPPNYFGDCYGCFNINEVMNETNKYDSLVVYNYETNSYRDIKPIRSIINWDTDSLSKFSEYITYNGFKVNTLHPNHHILSIDHYSNYGKKSKPDFRKQYYFQSIDYGKTWKYLFLNEDVNNLIIGNSYYINPYDNTLWLVKGNEKWIGDIRVSTQALYKSKESIISSVEEVVESKVSITYTDKGLVVNSKSSMLNSRVQLFDLESRCLYNSIVDVHKGENIINMNTPLLTGYYLVIITFDNNEKEIVNIINTR